MSFNINKEIITKLDYQDVSLIAVAFGVYKEQCGDRIGKELLQRINRLVDRLGRELYDCKQDEPNGH